MQTYLTEAPAVTVPLPASRPLVLSSAGLSGGVLLDEALRMRAALRRVRGVGLLDSAELSRESDAAEMSCQ